MNQARCSPSKSRQTVAHIGTSVMFEDVLIVVTYHINQTVRLCITMKRLGKKQHLMSISVNE